MVLDHDGLVRKGLRRRPMGQLRRQDLPDHVPTLDELYAACGTVRPFGHGAGFELSVDVRDTATAAAVVDVARAASPGAPKHLWLCHPDWRRLAQWRPQFPDVRLVNSTRLRDMREGPERRAAELARLAVDAVNLHYTEWTGGLTTLFHRFDRLAFGWDAQHERVLRDLVRMGIDGVYGDHVDRMVSVVGTSPGA